METKETPNLAQILAGTTREREREIEWFYSFARCSPSLWRAEDKEQREGGAFKTKTESWSKENQARAR